MPEPGYVPPEINVPRAGAVLVVGRDPGGKETEEGRPFVGPAGEHLDLVLSHVGLRRADCNIVNVCGYQPEDNDFKKHDERRVEEGMAEVRALARQLKPKLIITLGNEAAYTFLPDVWPTNGRGVFGAKDIEERRGYFWDSSYGMVLTTLHPAGVLRKMVPGDYLLKHDFRRARKYLQGKLPRDEFPEVRRLRSQAQVDQLLRSRMIAWDIETKWSMTTLWMCGFCGDEGIPYVSLYPYEFNQYGRQILSAGISNIGHNRLFDDLAMLKFEGIDVKGEKHDTQQMWHALEPELAGRDEEDEDSLDGHKRSRMTRKGLAFLMTIYDFNVRWWKDYPVDREDDEARNQMIELNGRDSWSTRVLAECMLPDLEREGVMEQYLLGVGTYPALLKMGLRGLCVDEELRQQRLTELETRYEALKEQAADAMRKYIKLHDLRFYMRRIKCPCCGGGKVQVQACPRCSGYEKPPKTKQDWHQNAPEPVRRAISAQGHTDPTKAPIKAYRAILGLCTKCLGTGKVDDLKPGYPNPYSEKQLKQFLHNDLAAPKHTFRGKTVTDAAALKKILRWAKGE